MRLRRGAAEPPRHVTLRDVAKVAGVSPATVSRALAKDERISSETRDLVVRASDQLGYVPNSAARSLILRATSTLGVLIPDVTDPMHGQFVTGFEKEAVYREYTVILANGFHDAARERQALRVFASHRVDGIALMGSVLDQVEVRALFRRAPAVFVNGENLSLAGYQSELPVGCIRANDIGGIEAMMGHLFQEGCRTFAYVNGPQGASNVTRRDTVLRCLREAGIRGSLVQHAGDLDGLRSVTKLASKIAADRPDVVICYDDKLALSTIDALRGLGIHVPNDIAVVGFDDIPFASMASPRLTTVAQPAAQMGQLAVEMLMSAIHGEGLPASSVVPVQLIARESSRRMSFARQ